MDAPKTEEVEFTAADRIRQLNEIDKVRYMAEGRETMLIT